MGQDTRLNPGPVSEILLMFVKQVFEDLERIDGRNKG